MLCGAAYNAESALERAVLHQIQNAIQPGGQGLGGEGGDDGAHACGVGGGTEDLGLQRDAADCIGDDDAVECMAGEMLLRDA